MFSSLRSGSAYTLLAAAGFCLLGACARPHQPPTTLESAAAVATPDKAHLKLADILPRPQFSGAEDGPARSAEYQPDPRAMRYLRKGEKRFEEQLWAEAITTLEKALQFDPRLPQAHILLARASLQHGNFGLAERHLRQVLDLEPRNVAAYQLLGEIAWQQDKPDEAIRLFRLALLAAGDDVDRPEVVLARLSLAMALRKQGYLAAAADQLQAYLDATAQPTPAMTQYHELKEAMSLYRGKSAGIIGDIQTELKDYDSAVAAYRRAVTEKPNDPALRRRLTYALARAGQADQAVESARQWLVDFPQEANGFELLKETCDLLGTPQRYGAELVHLAEQTTDPAMGEHLAGLLLARHKVPEAIVLLKRITAQPSVGPDPRYLLARLYAQKGDVERSYRLLIETLRAYPKTDELFRSALSGKEDKLNASKYLDPARKLAGERPNDALARFGFGLLLASENQDEQAVAEMKTTTTLDPSFGPAYGALGRLYLAKKQWQNAIDTADAAIAGGLRRADVYLVKGLAHDALDEVDDAETALLEAFRLDRKSAAALYRLGLSAERRGDRKRCEQLYRRILNDVDPHFIPARERLVRLYLNSGKLEKAREYFSDFKSLGQAGPAVGRCQAMLALTTSTAPRGKGRLNAYLAALRAILKKYPPDAVTYLDIAKSYYAVNDFAKALAAVKQGLAINPDDIPSLELKATLQASLLEFGTAAATVRMLLRDHPRNLGYLQRLLEYAENQGEYDTAIGLLKRLLARDDLAAQRSLFTRSLLAVLQAAKRYDEAVATAKTWLDAAPEDPVRRRYYLAALDRADRHDRAIGLARKYLEEDPTNRDLQIQLLAQLQDAKRFVEAQQLVLTWLADAADDIELNEALVRLCWSAKKWDDAIDIARTGAELSENRARYEAILGQSYRSARRYDEAVDFYRHQANTLQTESAYQRLAAVLIEAERYHEAERTVEKVMRPQLAARDAGKRYDAGLILRMRNFLVEIYQDTDRQAQAIQQLEAMHKLDPNDPLISNNLGYTWADAGMHLAKAEKLIRYALSQDPRSSANLDSLAGCSTSAAGMRGRSITFASPCVWPPAKTPCSMTTWAMRCTAPAAATRPAPTGKRRSSSRRRAPSRHPIGSAARSTKRLRPS